MFYQAKIISNGFYGVCEVVPSACVSGKVYGNNTVGLGNINALYWCFVYYYGDSCITKYSNVPASFLSTRLQQESPVQKDWAFLLEPPLLHRTGFSCAPKAQEIRFAFAARSDEAKTIEYCFSRGKPQARSWQSREGEATDNDYATACGQGKCPP